MLDLRDRDETAFVMAEDQRRAGVGAEVDLPPDHLLHGEVAGRNPEFLEFDAVFLQQPGTQQVIGRHAPEVGLVALPDCGLCQRGARREGRGQQRADGGEIVAARDSRHDVPPLPARPSDGALAACPSWFSRSF